MMRDTYIILELKVNKGLKELLELTGEQGTQGTTGTQGDSNRIYNYWYSR